MFSTTALVQGGSTHLFLSLAACPCPPPPSFLPVHRGMSPSILSLPGGLKQSHREEKSSKARVRGGKEAPTFLQRVRRGVFRVRKSGQQASKARQAYSPAPEGKTIYVYSSVSMLQGMPLLPVSIMRKKCPTAGIPKHSHVEREKVGYGGVERRCVYRLPSHSTHEGQRNPRRFSPIHQMCLPSPSHSCLKGEMV